MKNYQILIESLEHGYNLWKERISELQSHFVRNLPSEMPFESGYRTLFARQRNASRFAVKQGVSVRFAAYGGSPHIGESPNLSRTMRGEDALGKENMDCSLTLVTRAEGVEQRPRSGG